MTLETLKKIFSGDLYVDSLHRHIYATDASVYQKVPQLVACPKNTTDLRTLIAFAHDQNLSLVSRGAGTSLAGQCVTSDVVVDIGKFFNDIVHIDKEHKTVSVQPGVIRDELNRILEKDSLFFGPNTSTSNRCMIGGMVGNNSSGTTSIQYGVTRDKVLSLKCLLADQKEVEFRPIPIEDCKVKAQQNDCEGLIYQHILKLLSDKNLQHNVLKYFPKPQIHRRNTGYAIDDLVKHYKKTGFINLARLICGSEGTLCFITEIKLQLEDLPPQHAGMIAAHFRSIEDCLQTVPIAMQHDLHACEMMDDTILDCTKNHLEYKDYRFFIKEKPKAILFFELKSDSEQDLNQQLLALQNDLKEKTNTYAFPNLKGDEINKAFTLRKAGLGLLGSMIGDDKAVACIEDTAVAIEDLQAYIKDFTKLMKHYNQKPVYYAHAGAGELHLRPILNLKTQKGVIDFKAITNDVAKLVKSYNGSLSGEHGDGIVRSDFIKLMLGDHCYDFLSELKYCFDPQNIFNTDKIIKKNTISRIDKNLRYTTNRKAPEPASFMNFTAEQDLLHAAENCNGSGDCRKTEKSAGAMCPSYHATKNEKDTTRARANALRHFLTDPNAIDKTDLMNTFELCISCKACKRECPSNVDVSSFKAEITYQYYQENTRPLRDYMIGYNDDINAFLQPISKLHNYIISQHFISKSVNKVLGFHRSRSLPNLSPQSFFKIFRNLHQVIRKSPSKIKTVYLFVDEFTNRLESDLGIDAVKLLNALGYEVKILPNKQSGRALLSKGFLKQAKAFAEYNIDLYKDIINDKTPLLGIEPSAVMCFRDDYLRLSERTKIAENLAKHTFLIEEFISKEIEEGFIKSNQFQDNSCEVKLHIHCHQKALSNSKYTFDMVNILEKAKVSIIPSGCCGMAGGFGYEKEHYDISMKIGDLILLPAIKNAKKETFILANGSSCRHQIMDATSRTALHPISFMKMKLK